MEVEAFSIVGSFDALFTIGASARTVSISAELAAVRELCSTLSCFSQPLPVQTRQGRLWTISSGARSRWAARVARIRCIKRVTKVRAEGSIRIITNVIIGLPNKKYQKDGVNQKNQNDIRIPFPSGILCSNQQRQCAQSRMGCVRI